MAGSEFGEMGREDESSEKDMHQSFENNRALRIIMKSAVHADARF